MPKLDPDDFTAPGPGTWELEQVHLHRPMTRLALEEFRPAFGRGFAEALDLYGSLIKEMRFRSVNRFDYSQVAIVGAPDGGRGAPPKFVLWLMMRLHPAIRAQRKKANAAFEGRIWRADLRRWDEEAKPRSNQRHLELGSVDLAALSNPELADHVDACLAQWKEMSHQHAYFSVAAMLPLGDFLNQVSAWSGRSSESLLAIFPQADPLLEAIAADQAASALLASGDAADAILAGLAEHPTIGPLLDAYLKLIGPRIIGYDIADRTALENPGLLLDGLRAMQTRDHAAGRAAGERHAAAAREAVPVERRPDFDELLREARNIYRLRDERGLFSDSVAGGLLRAAILEVGRRAVAAGSLQDAEHAVEADVGELRRLAQGDEGLAADLADRFDFRTAHTVDDAPDFLGGMPSEPPPMSLIPAGGLRCGMEAFVAMMGLVFDPVDNAPAPDDQDVLAGRAAGVGAYEGIARVVHSPADFDRIEAGDVLVTRSTSPTYNVVLGRVGGIVTDHGGVLSHAAIVAREFGIPAVVACGNATSVIPDGARVRVNTEDGCVTVLR